MEKIQNPSNKSAGHCHCAQTSEFYFYFFFWDLNYKDYKLAERNLTGAVRRQTDYFNSSRPKIRVRMMYGSFLFHLSDVVFS